jgi:hypothetical protein
MKSIKTLLPLFSAALLMTACGQSTSIPTSVSAPALVRSYQAPINQQIMVRFRPEATRTALMQFNNRYGMRTVRFNTELNVFVMESVNPRANITTLINAMSKDPSVMFAEVNQQIQVNPVVDMQVKPIFNY